MRVERLSECGFDDLFRIYRANIAVSEQKSRLALEAMARRSDYRFYVAISEHDAIVGFSILYVPDARRFGLLEYMAVDRAAQGQGIGRELFLEGAGEGQRAILLEVDSDREIADDYASRLRRIKFYRSLGCRRIKGLAYIMPRVGISDPPPMDLYTFGDRADWLTKQDLRDRLITIYRGVYQRPADDPNIERMLKLLGEIVPLE